MLRYILTIIVVLCLSTGNPARAETNCAPDLFKDWERNSGRADIKLTVINMVSRSNFKEVKDSGLLKSISGNDKFTASYDAFDSWRQGYTSRTNIDYNMMFAQDYAASRFSEAGSNAFIDCIPAESIEIQHCAVRNRRQ